MKRQDVLTNPRMAGQVERYHTWPILRRQSNGEHTWQVMRIFVTIFGKMTPAVSYYILFHDAGEIKTGDLPFPVKSQNPQVKSTFDMLERAALLEFDVELPKLLPEDRDRIKVCDLIEMHEFGLFEKALGNIFAEPIIVDTLAAVDRLMRTMCVPDQQAIRKYVAALAERYG